VTSRPGDLAPETGVNTVLEAARSHIAHFFVAASLMTPRATVRLFPAAAPCEEVASYLREHNYDLAVVADGEGHLLYVPVDDLAAGDRGPVGPAARPIDRHHRIAAQASVVEVVARFAATDFQFVFDEAGAFDGLMTYADLNKPPVHVLFFIVITRFERLLRRVVIRLYDGDTWLQRLPESSRRDIGAVYVAEKANGVETSLLECTTITHLKEILQRDGSWIVKAGYRSREAFKRSLAGIIHWRNLVMHSRRVVSTKEDARSLLPLLEEIGEHATRTSAWLEGSPIVEAE
jgi:hypothetical protein